MINKIIHYRCIWLIFCVLLTACAQRAISPLTAVPIPVIDSPTPVPAFTLIPVTITPSPLPTEPIIPFIPPDVLQIEKWNEYEDVLAKTIFSYLPPEKVVCEWEILGRASQDVYVSAYCASVYSAGPSGAWIPAVIHLGMDGSVLSAEIPGAGTAYATDIQRMFPPDVQEMIFDRVALASAQQMADRMRWRRGHPDEPPWIVFSLLSTPPTPQVIPWITPEPAQAEKWKEYQTVLAGEFDYRPAQDVLCEWENLGRSGSEVYLWVVCGSKQVGLEGLARIGVVDGNIVSAIRSDNPILYPAYVLERYYSGMIHFQKLVDHLRWRQSHWEEPPLIVIYANSVP